MTKSETERSGLPVALEPRGAAPSLKRSETTAAFVSQLIAERARLAPQRQRRRASPEGAASAYDSSAKGAVKRMPIGYRTSILA